jgi:hypothetical protein
MSTSKVEKKGELTLEGPTEDRYRTNVLYSFRCSCGRERKMTLLAFRQAVYPTCKGTECLAKRVTKAALPRGDAAWNRLIAQYIAAARHALLPYELTRAQAIALFQKNCYYCGRPPSLETHSRLSNGSVRWNGIDRYDNLLGYTPENTVTCCWICNPLKGPMHGDDFLAHVRRIVVNRRFTAVLSEKQHLRLLEKSANILGFRRDLC